MSRVSLDVLLVVSRLLETLSRRWEVQVVLANTTTRPQRGGKTRPLPRARHPARPADPQHGHHDGHLRAHCLCAQTAAQLDQRVEQLNRHNIHSATIYNMYHKYALMLMIVRPSFLSGIQSLPTLMQRRNK